MVYSPPDKPEMWPLPSTCALDHQDAENITLASSCWRRGGFDCGWVVVGLRTTSRWVGGLAYFSRAAIPVGGWVVFLLFCGVFSGRSADFDRNRVGGWSSRRGHEAPSRWVGGWFWALTSRDQPPTTFKTATPGARVGHSFAHAVQKKRNRK